jgi:hypothetical protein
MAGKTSGSSCYIQLIRVNQIHKGHIPGWIRIVFLLVTANNSVTSSVGIVILITIGN